MRPPTPRLRVNSEDLVDCDASGPPFMLTTHNAISTLSTIHNQSPQLNAFVADSPTRNLHGDSDEIFNAFASIGHTENISSV